jgi:hypothetical protein
LAYHCDTVITMASNNDNEQWRYTNSRRRPQPGDGNPQLTTPGPRPPRTSHEGSAPGIRSPLGRPSDLSQRPREAQRNQDDRY